MRLSREQEGPSASHRFGVRQCVSRLHAHWVSQCGARLVVSSRSTVSRARLHVAYVRPPHRRMQSRTSLTRAIPRIMPRNHWPSHPRAAAGSLGRRRCLAHARRSIRSGSTSARVRESVDRRTTRRGTTRLSVEQSRARQSAGSGPRSMTGPSSRRARCSPGGRTSTGRQTGWKWTASSHRPHETGITWVGASTSRSAPAMHVLSMRLSVASGRVTGHS